MTPRRAPRLHRLLPGACALLGALLALLVSALPALAAEPTQAAWRLQSRAVPTNLPSEGEGAIEVTVSNLGDAAAKGSTANPIKIIDTLPAGLEAIGSVVAAGNPGGASRYSGGGKEAADFKCPKEQGRVVECTFPHPLMPSELLQFLIHVKTSFGPQEVEAVTNELEVHEEGVLVGHAERALAVSGKAVPFGIEPGGFELVPEGETFQADTQSGSHPFQLTTYVNFNQVLTPDLPGGTPFPGVAGLSKTLSFRLPAGLLGNPTAVPECTDAEFGALEKGDVNLCPEDTAIGVADVTYNDVGIGPALEYATAALPVFNLEPGSGEPARFGFEVAGVPVVLNTSVRTGTDYGATITVPNTSDAVQVLGTAVTIWGTPGDARHDDARGWACLGGESRTLGIESYPYKCGEDPLHNQKAFLTLPTSCGSQEALAEGTEWDEKETMPVISAAFTLEGCSALPFNPSIEVKTDEHTASTPSGLTVEVSVPQEGILTEGQLAQADIKETTLELPPELQTSAGAANGLGACLESEAGFIAEGGSLAAQLENQHFSFLPPSEREQGEELTCPSASKIGTVEIETPFLKHPVTGSAYLASQDTSPFASPLVLYLIAEEPESKVLVKLAGEVEITASGQLISRFKHTPQVAFEHLKLDLFNGAGAGAETAAQATPARCGAYTAKASFDTWSQEAGEPYSATSAPEGLAITSGPHGGACTQQGEKLPFALGFAAGVTNTEAGKYTEFTLTLARPDGSQALSSIAMELPPGAAAKLASVTPCAEPAAWEGKCGPESLVGESTTYTGLGNAPYKLAGQVYLTGPYDGAPFGLSTVTPATKVGPFNIGTIVVRSAIRINETTAAASIETAATRVYASTGAVESYPGLPELIKGLPAQIKQLDVNVNRPEFEFNPTNCDQMAVTGTLAGSEGTDQAVSTPFKAQNCAALPFAPKLTATVVGQGSKLDGTTFAVKIESPGLGQANIHKVDLTIPSRLPSRLTTIQKACLEATFNTNPASCDEGSVIGEGIVNTPVFKNPLRGPAYLVSHGGAAFPDVEFVLQGEGVKIVLDGKTNIHEGVTYSKFETAPDAPFTSFETVLPAGPHSALTANVPESEDFNLCKQTLTVPAEITGQNGAFISQTTKVSILGCKGVAAFKAKKLTRAQKLTKALKACRTKYKGKSKKAKLQKCEKQARKQYGPLKKKKKKSKKKK